MCRMFAVRADRPVSAEALLVSAPHSLMRQSCCDLRGECHDSGWGVGYYAGDNPKRVRSARPAADDPLYADTARTAVSPILIGHVRQASVGSIAERNNHPFVFGRWLFAHNGTLEGFGDDPSRLLRQIPDNLRGRIEGETDSEHAFFFLLGRLERTFGSLEAPGEADAVADIVRDAVRELVGLYPGTEAEPSRLNFVLTDGAMLAASRWAHTLHLLEQHGTGPVGTAAAAAAVLVASEPITPDGWKEVPDRSVVLIRPDLRCTVTSIG